MREFIIRFSDLSYAKQEELIKEVEEEIKQIEGLDDELRENVGADPTDPARIDPDSALVWINQRAKKLTDDASTSLMIEITI